MLEAIKGAAAMAIVITAAMIVLDSAWLGDFAPWGAVLLAGLVTGGVMGWQRSRRAPEITIRDFRDYRGAAGVMIETAARLKFTDRAPDDLVMPPPVATPEPPATRVIVETREHGGCA